MKSDRILKIIEIVVTGVSGILGAIATIKSSKIKNEDIDAIADKAAQKILDNICIDKNLVCKESEGDEIFSHPCEDYI